MNAHTSYALLAILAAAGAASIAPALADSHEGDHMMEDKMGDHMMGDKMMDAMMMEFQEGVPLAIRTDRSAYDHDSTIMIDGKVANIRPGTPVTMTVVSPGSNIVAIRQLDVGSDGTYSTSLSTAGPLWKYDGTYTIRVQYGDESINNRAMVELTGGEGPVAGAPAMADCGASEVAAADQCIPYSITGGSVSGAQINDRDNSIIVMVDSSDDGELVLSPSAGTIDGIFMVLVDGQEWDDSVIDGNEVTVMFPAGTEEIEVIGTFVIPEFGAVAALVLAAAIVSIVAVTARSRLSVVPRL